MNAILARALRGYMIKISNPDIGPAEVNAVVKVMDSGHIAQGKEVEALEVAFAKYCGTKYAIALNSGTAAIHCALFGAGVGVGDEVITSPFSFMATINPILMQGAKPVFVDIEPESFGIAQNNLEKAITKKTKAILPVHLYGQPVDFLEISKIAKAKRIPIIEDACQAIGAAFRGKQVGNLGEAAAFSLYATKNITSGEGGMLTTNNRKIMEATHRFRQHGMSSQYEYAHLGYNYRMTDMQAAIALIQLRKANKYNKARQENAKIYTELLKDIPGLIRPTTKQGRTHVFHQYTIRITSEFPNTRDNLQQFLLKKNITTGIYYHKPLHFYRHVAKLGYKKGDFRVGERVAKQVLSLPVHPKVTHKQIETIATAIREASSGKK